MMGLSLPLVEHLFGQKLSHMRGRVKVSYIAKISFTLALYKPWCPLLSQGVFWKCQWAHGLFTLSHLPISVGVANRLEKNYIDFLWGGIGDEFMFHLMKWSKICTPIILEGLGAKNMNRSNWALLDKWSLWYAMEREALWRLVVDNKYDNLRGGWCSKRVVGPYGVGCRNV